MLGRASTVNLLPLLCIMAATSTTINSTPLTSNHETSPDQQLPQQADTNQQDSQTYMSNYVKQQRSPLMQVRKLSSAGNNITCNDGSQVGYYQRLNQHSKSWVIYLQGGGFCGSRESCRQRWHRTPLLMSSKYWSNTKTGESRPSIFVFVSLLVLLLITADSLFGATAERTSCQTARRQP